MAEIIKKISDYDDKSLLIVDDDGPFRDRLSRSMEKKGFKVTQAESVKSGIQKAKENKPTFAVIDLRLGDGLFSAMIAVDVIVAKFYTWMYFSDKSCIRCSASC